MRRDAARIAVPRSVLAALQLPDHATAVPAAGGSHAPVWRIDADGRRYALRMRPLAERDAIQREATAMRAAASGGIPVPDVVQVRVAGDLACLLTTWCPGETLAAAILDHGAAPLHLGAACGRLQAQLHAIPAPPAIAAQGTGWLSPTPEEERLLAGVPDREGSRLLHLDFHPLNILTDGLAITGVVDWVNAAAGDPRQDLARTLAILRLELPAHIASPDAERSTEALADAWARGYEERAGLLRSMPAFMAWAGLRTVRDLAGKRSAAAVQAMAARVAVWVRDAAT